MRHVTHSMAKGKQGSALWGRGRAEPSGPQQEREEPSSTAGGQNQGPKYQIKAPSRPRKHLRVGYLLVAAPAGCLVGGELLLHMGGLVHLLGVKGQAAQRAQRGWHLQAWLEALPAEPAGGRGQGAWAPAHMGQQLSAASCVFLETLTSEPKSHWLDGHHLAKGFPPSCGLLGCSAISQSQAELQMCLYRTCAGPKALVPARVLATVGGWGSALQSHHHPVITKPQGAQRTRRQHRGPWRLFTH